MENFGYLFVAYTFIWIAVLAYVYTIARQQRHLEREIRDLRQRWRSKAGQDE